MELKDLLRDARAKRGLSQQEAATRAGITVQHWGQIERGKEPGSAETVANMALTVGLTPDQLEDAGRDQAADMLRQMRAETDGSGEGEPLDDVLMLQAIMRKLNTAELRWVIDHADALASLGSHHIGTRNSA